MDNKKKCCLSGEKLNYLVVTTANAIAADKTAEEIDLLAIFFTLLGDALSVITASRALCEAINDEGEDDPAEIFTALE